MKFVKTTLTTLAVQWPCPAVERMENTGSNPFTAHGPGNFVPQTLQFKSLWWNNLLNFYGTESFVACMVETKISQYTLACIFPFLSVFVILVHSFGSIVWFSFPWPWLQCVHLNNSICNAQPHYHILPPLPSPLSHWCFNSRGQIFYSVPLLEIKKKQKKQNGLLKAQDFDSTMIILMSFLLLVLTSANVVLTTSALAIQWRAINYCYPLVTICLLSGHTLLAFNHSYFTQP